MRLPSLGAMRPPRSYSGESLRLTDGDVKSGRRLAGVWSISWSAFTPPRRDRAMFFVRDERVDRPHLVLTQDVRESPPACRTYSHRNAGTGPAEAARAGARARRHRLPGPSAA